MECLLDGERAAHTQCHVRVGDRIRVLARQLAPLCAEAVNLP